MPVEECEVDGTPGRRWGAAGKCYPCTRSGDGWDCSDAHAKAEAQGRAVEGSAVTEAAVLSPGRALSDRLEVIDVFERRFERAMARFLLEIEMLAMRDGSATLTAAGVLDDADAFDSEGEWPRPSRDYGPRPFTLGVATEAWLWASADVRDALAGMHGEAARAAAVETLLRDFAAFAVVLDAFDSARAVLDAATGQGWSSQALSRALGEALDLDAARTVPGRVRADSGAVDALEVEGTTYRAAARSAGRTEAARHYNGAALERIRGMGVADMHKRWVANHDTRTRATHRDADGQTVPVEEQFSVGADLLDYPADEMGSARETINCRCGIVAVPPTEEGKIPLPPTKSGMYQGRWGGYNAPEG